MLVNCSRGALIDTDAVWRALTAGPLSGVGLDVFDPEPPSPHPLYDHPGVVLTPHVSWYSEDSILDLQNRITRNVAQVCVGKKPDAVVNPDVLTKVKLA